MVPLFWLTLFNIQLHKQNNFNTTSNCSQLTIYCSFLLRSWVRVPYDTLIFYKDMDVTVKGFNFAFDCA